jgi:hydrogenase maturation protease
MSRLHIIVMGLGNVLLGDDGLGVYAVRTLKNECSHPQISYYDGGTRGLDLLPLMEEGSHLLILDSIKGKGRPGSIVEITEENLSFSIPLKFSIHDVALPDLLALLRLRRGETLKKMLVLGMIPGSLTISDQLSPELQTSLPQLISRATEILQQWLGSKQTTVEKSLCA